MKPEATLLIPNPLLNPLEKSGLELIKNKYPIDRQYQYYAVYKRRVKGFNLVVLKQSSFIKSEYWLKLNLFDLNGRILDTLTFAGEKVGYYDKYGRISPDLNITTLSYFDMKEDTTNLDNYYATEIRKEYTISNEGGFTLVKSIKERGYFTNYGECNIVSRVDTIEGKYRH